MADFDWNWPKKIERDLIERALTLDFIREGRNLVLIGTNGLGKTMIAKNIAHQAVLAGYSVLFTTAAELHRRPPGRLSPAPSAASSAATPACQLLVHRRGRLSLLRLPRRRPALQGRRPPLRDSSSILLTTNLAFRDWNTVFPNATSIATLLDKLTHHADVTLIEGDSYRVHESQKEAAARRKKRS